MFKNRPYQQYCLWISAYQLLIPRAMLFILIAALASNMCCEIGSARRARHHKEACIRESKGGVIA